MTREVVTLRKATRCDCAARFNGVGRLDWAKHCYGVERCGRAQDGWRP